MFIDFYVPSILCGYRQSLSENIGVGSRNKASSPIEYYKDNLKMPVHNKKREVFPPVKVLKLLRSVGKSIHIALACSQ